MAVDIIVNDDQVDVTATEEQVTNTVIPSVLVLPGEGGKDGKDGFSPVISISAITGGNRITITDANGTHTVDVLDGKDGKNGSPGQDGNGISSAVLNADYTLTLTFDDGTKYTTPSIRGATGATGSSGKDGSNGKDGTSVTVKSVSESTADGGSNVVTFSDGKTLTVKNGKTGATGDKGADGKTPVVGEDYYTEAEKTEMVNDVIVKLSDKLSLGIASDGLIYLFVDGQPVGTGIPQGASGDVFGYVDENNTIVLSGALADGTYTVKYEMEDGSVLEIGDMVLGKVEVYYSVTSNLTACVSNNSVASVVEGGSYSATITANSGYMLSSVKVTMGGTDVSASAVSGGNINITSVTGDIVITAVATEIVVSYQQCAYIENTSMTDSFVDLGYVNTEATGMQVTFELAEEGQHSNVAFFGNSDIACGATSANSDMRAYIGGVKSYQLIASPATNTAYTVGVNYQNSGKASIDGTSKNMNSGTKTFKKSETLTLCKQNGGTQYSRGWYTRIKEAYISEGTNIVKHYVPAYRKPDGAIGMLETNSNTFIPATGNFTKGADV